MNKELENKVPVAEQVNELEQADEAIQYTLGSDGAITLQEKGIENPEAIVEK